MLVEPKAGEGGTGGGGEGGGGEHSKAVDALGSPVELARLEAGQEPAEVVELSVPSVSREACDEHGTDLAPQAALGMRQEGADQPRRGFDTAQVTLLSLRVTKVVNDRRLLEP